MNRGLKVLNILVSLLLLSVLLTMMILCAPDVDGFLKIQRWQFVTDFLTNAYFRQYLFWVAGAFSVLLVMAILVMLFYPNSQQNFTLQSDGGRLTLEKKAIEGLVRAKLPTRDFVEKPKVTVHATKNKIQVKINGQLRRTSSLINQTETLTTEIRQELQQLLGQRQVHVDVTFTDWQKSQPATDHSRVI